MSTTFSGPVCLFNVHKPAIYPQCPVPCFDPFLSTSDTLPALSDYPPCTETLHEVNTSFFEPDCLISRLGTCASQVPKSTNWPEQVADTTFTLSSHNRPPPLLSFTVSECLFSCGTSAWSSSGDVPRTTPRVTPPRYSTIPSPHYLKSASLTGHNTTK